MTTWWTTPICGAAEATANTLFGNPASVLVGDFLYSRAFQLMVEQTNMRVMQVLADATNTIAEGEVLQLLNCHNAGCHGGGLSAGHPLQDGEAVREPRARSARSSVSPRRRWRRASARYGMHLGTALPAYRRRAGLLWRPCADRQAPGEDLAEGKPTLPLICAHPVRNARAGRR